MEKPRLSDKPGYKRKADDLEGLEPYARYLIDLVVELQRENSLLYTALDYVIKKFR